MDHSIYLIRFIANCKSATEVKPIIATLQSDALASELHYKEMLDKLGHFIRLSIKTLNVFGLVWFYQIKVVKSNLTG